MRLEFPEFGHHGETLAAVVVGALLATVSGIVANQIEAHLRRRERERLAALLLGEVLSTVKVLLEAADAARRQPPPYGLVTRRMLRAARRELEIYERNREVLVDVRDAALRADLHRLAVQLVMPLDGILDSLVDHRDEDEPARERGFEFMMEAAERIPGVAARLGAVARHRFDHIQAVVGPTPAAPPPAST